MKKNILHNTNNKTGHIHFRVDGNFKEFAQELADQYFGGNLSVMFRFALYHCDLGNIGEGSTDGFVGKDFTSLSSADAEWLAQIHEDYGEQNRLLSAIGNNVNQIAHHTNAQAISHPSPITRGTMEDLDDMATSLKSIRTTNANMWKRAKEYTMKKQDG